MCLVVASSPYYYVRSTVSLNISQTAITASPFLYQHRRGLIYNFNISDISTITDSLIGTAEGFIYEYFANKNVLMDPWEVPKTTFAHFRAPFCLFSQSFTCVASVCSDSPAGEGLPSSFPVLILWFQPVSPQNFPGSWPHLRVIRCVIMHSLL